jgi:hypothetical protein
MIATCIQCEYYKEQEKIQWCRKNKVAVGKFYFCDKFEMLANSMYQSKKEYDNVKCT